MTASPIVLTISSSRTEHLSGTGAERLDDGDGLVVAVGLGDGGETGEVDEGERGVEVGCGHGGL